MSYVFFLLFVGSAAKPKVSKKKWYFLDFRFGRFWMQEDACRSSGSDAAGRPLIAKTFPNNFWGDRKWLLNMNSHEQ